MSETLASSTRKLRLDDHDDPGPTNTPAQSPPISMLSDDILFLIFLINSVTEMLPFNKENMGLDIVYEKGTLTTNRYSSQVCRRWRNIILSSPTIWANSLNIDELNQRREEWRWEVLGRTGNAPLTLIGRIEYMYLDEGNHVKDFIEEVLTKDWGRIRYFSLCTNHPDVVEYMFYAMQKPAPILEYFLYWTVSNEEDNLDDEGLILFDGYSPKLTFFCCDGVKHDFTPGSMSNVRQLWLAGPQTTFTIPELYRGLHHLPLLEELNINWHYHLFSAIDLDDNTPALSLPRLADITIHTCGGTLVSNLVKHLSPARGCHLVVSGGMADKMDDFEGIDVLELSQVYATFIKEYADFGSIPYLSLTYHREIGFSLRAGTGPRDHSLKEPPSNYPNIAFGYQSDGRIGESLNLDLFSAPVLNALASWTDLSHIKKVNLILDESATIHSRPQVLALLRKISLGSVVHLTTDLPTLRVLINTQPALGLDGVIFPHLTTITMAEWEEGIPSHDLGAFLDGRLKSGNPVKFLELSMRSYGNKERWQFLDDISGLSVVWLGPVSAGIPGKYQYVELNGRLVPANTIPSTNLA